VKQALTHAGSLVALLLFASYWTATLLYVSPNNPIRAGVSESMDIFGQYFPQRWGFFAPPPKADMRIYFAYHDHITGEETTRLEILAPIVEVKHRTAPFNADAEVMDYLLASPALAIVEAVNANASVLETTHPDEKDSFYMYEAQRLVNELGNHIPSYLTLRNYAAIVAERIGLDPDWYDVKFSIAFEDLPHVSEVRLGRDESKEATFALAFESWLLPLGEATRAREVQL
jgi:hypothetical protein